MSDVLKFITTLRDRGISLRAEGSDLRYTTSLSPPTDEELQLLRAHKAVILDLLTLMGSDKPSVAPPIEAVSRVKPLVLSFAQQRLLFLLQMDGSSEAYHIPLYMRLRGPLNQDALRRALEGLVERHEILRTRIQTADGTLSQLVDAPGDAFKLEQHELSEEQLAETRLSDLMLEEIRKPFDLRNGHPFRAKIVVVAKDDHALLLTVHHIAADGWSAALLTQELATLYNAAVAGVPSPLFPLPIQYADFAAWQRRWLSAGAQKAHSAYWRVTLAEAPESLALPTDRPRPRVQEFRGDTIRVEINEALTQRLNVLAQQHELTLFMVLLAAWAIVLSRLSGQDDVIIGAPTANRLRSDTEGLIGLFVNTLALRIDLSADPTLEDILLRTRSAVVAAQTHQELPFEQVVEAVKPVRSPAHTPLFQVMFAWQNVDTTTVELSGLTLSDLQAPMPTAKYDLTLDLGEHDGKVVGTLNYATALFEQHTAQRNVGYLCQILECMVEDVKCPASRVDLLTPEERHQLLSQWNDTTTEPHEFRCIHELFEEQVRRTPETLALLFEDERISYGELNQRANRLARYLRFRGVEAEDLVALCVSRSTDLIVGLLAILKAGGAYVPLDPSYPSARLLYILDDARPRIVLTELRFIDTLSPAASELIALDRDSRHIVSREASDLTLECPQLRSSSLAYVIYTSGSTGDPKGVLGEHGGMFNRICAQSTIAPFSSTDICCNKTSVGFVDALFETLGPLSHGLPIVLAPDSALNDVEQLGELIARHRVTRIITVPSLARAMLEIDSLAECLGGLRNWTLSGEALQPDLLTRLQRRLPECAFVNLYGCSEIAADATFFLADHRERPYVPIGRPLSNCRVYVLDRYLQPVPIGVTGEICVAGAGVARGYWQRPALTDEKFLRDVFSSHHAARMYRTGDLGRWRADGLLEYLGRTDHQVKLRGHRVELGEIEAQLLRFDQVADAAVMLREDSPSIKRLVAYVCTRVGRHLKADGLRAHLQEQLPAHLLPNAIVFLERMPRTLTGKLKRDALPPPEVDAFATERYEPPLGTVEQTLAGIWKRLLTVDQVGRHDNFFALGGHSLLIARLMTGITEEFSIQFHVKVVFQSPTLAEMAMVIERLAIVSSAVPATDYTELEVGEI